MEEGLQQTARRRKVCVVGAGAAGLCAARHLARDSNAFEFEVYEASSDLGGTWIYTDRVGVDDDGRPIHSSMYKYLRTNLPKEIMKFPDFDKFKEPGRSSVTHETVLDYLKDYATHFNLRQFIHFNTVVECIKPERHENDSATEKWKVRVKNIKSSETKELIFDAIIVCNGHYFDPYIPDIPGLSNFTGQVLHSHNYRTPEDFTGKKVILLGASNSGVDISIELSTKASRVYLSHNNNRVAMSLPSEIMEVQGIDRFENGVFVLKDDSTLAADVLIFCTGYLFTYPFLDNSCGIHVDENHVAPLYKHLVNVEHPTMCLVGVPTNVVPFPLFHMQVQYFLSILKGKSQFPPKSEMLEDSKPRTAKKRHAHKLSDAQWAYNDELAQSGGFDALPAYYKIGYEIWGQLRSRSRGDYKSWNLVLSDDGKSAQLIHSSGRGNAA